MIYLITCYRCCSQYVGETIHKLNIKGLTGIEPHLTILVNMASVAFYQICSHVKSAINCCNAYDLIQILNKFEENSTIARYVLDASITFRRKQQEKTWMLKLRNFYPYSLIDNQGD